MADVGFRSRRAESNWAAICCSAFSCMQLYWARLVLRKWFNVSATDSDYSADTDEDCEESATGAISQDFDPRTKDEYPRVETDDGPKLRRRNSETFRVQYLDTKAIRICAGTWNVGGRVPPADLDIDGWLDTVEPADIYVLGIQEIVPLNAGNVIGMENDEPASEWENIIRDALNRVRPRKSKIVSHSDPSSPTKFKPSKEVSYSIQDMFVESSHDACNAIRSVDNKPSSGEDAITNIDVLGSTNDNASCLPIQKYGHRQFSSPNTLDRMQINSDSRKQERFSYLNWPEPPLRLLNPYVSERRSSSKSKNLSLVNLRKPSYVRIVSKQMVGVFLTIWVRRNLRKHITNLCVSTVGVGFMGYIGNKGSVSVSMSIYQTPFCFLCTHLTSGEKDTDYQKRNEDVREIHRRTQFHTANGIPRSIRDHERTIWLGDFNYRINLSYEKIHELISRNEWQRLVENDQLSREMEKGNVFEEWSEGTLGFPPTYKYELDSDNYTGDEPESGKRKPAWCDRIIWKGKGMKLLSYTRKELKLSDHRPVTATFLAEVEVLCLWKLQRALALTYAEAFADA